MEFIFALIAALSLSSIPLILGWRRSAGEEQTARVLGIAARGKKFDPEKFALQTGTGLTFNQIAIGFGAWVGGSFFAGMALGFFASLLFAIAGGLLYAGTLADRRQAFTLSQAKDILRGLQVVETLLTQGKPCSTPGQRRRIPLVPMVRLSSSIWSLVYVPVLLVRKVRRCVNGQMVGQTLR